MFLNPNEFELMRYLEDEAARRDSEPPQPDGRAAHAVPPPVGVQLARLSKRYGARSVLDDISLTIRAGEFVAVVGRSGCGKSTLLRLLAGLERPDAAPGALRFDGVPVKGADPRVRLMFQEARLLPWRSVLANVGLGLPRWRLGQARDVLREVGLAGRAADWPSALSGGQRQRVALARALVHRPGLLLLDEPLGALDALTRIEMQQLIEGLWQRDGFTAVLVTHDVAEAVALADRILVIDEGKVVFDERVALARPRARGHPEFARMEARVLDVIFKRTPAPPPAPPPVIQIRHLRLAV
ncbi:sulfonate ABC transporter ATP-binding protein [Bordetella genomosp. 1]|uniref:Sulfonate ABC transporter ATP-binding protein n=1 Tax=Bordetella genomosp. 1 TaxID=1395607 RepID=A0A261SE71_9BORD|nr:ATP-binding cassette domain-containing protein [Bordetella genomosp. 1]OZI35361.1 sulfonate ABC transporter ATP-binding protein [Bordetella genomosp. 1]